LADVTANYSVFLSAHFDSHGFAGADDNLFKNNRHRLPCFSSFQQISVVAKGGSAQVVAEERNPICK
jgi:hypothetical protein